eukprot:TRINITY_DN1939_c0_g1_i3.p1 TRINITY_DN1939_c0_g1~~TRINITY_DN1939_c0_g1_i3.p1  ORF type:complete len:192 (-),score=21.35 TRINITY_DN1939_c0_g1_i3:82-585(-)
MALYGWALYEGVAIQQDRQRSAQLLSQSKHAMARALCLRSGIGVPQDSTACFEMLNTECDKRMLSICWAFVISSVLVVRWTKNAHFIAMHEQGIMYSRCVGREVCFSRFAIIIRMLQRCFEMQQSKAFLLHSSALPLCIDTALECRTTSNRRSIGTHWLPNKDTERP